MPIGAITGAIGAGTSLLGGIFGGNAASKAAAQQAAAGREAAAGQSAAGQQAQDVLNQQLSSARGVSAPYLGLGSSSAGLLQNALASGGALSGGWTDTFRAPTAEEAAATPGYQFQLQQGMNALQNSAAARGGLLSTGTAKNLLGYGQGLAATNYQNVFNNALNAYNTNYGTFRNNQLDLFNRLYGTTGLGLNAANALNANTAGTSNALASNLIGNAQLVGGDLMGVGNALAAGTMGRSNALWGGIGGAANAINQGLQLNSILGAQNASGGGGGGTPSYPALPSELQGQGVF